MIDIEKGDLYERMLIEFPFEGDQLNIRDLFLKYNDYFKFVKELNQYRALVNRIDIIVNRIGDHMTNSSYEDSVVEVQQELFRFNNGLNVLNRSDN